MKRKAIDELIKWKAANNRKPILLTGAKGVGKTYLAYDFARSFFDHIYTVQFWRDPFIKELFQTAQINETKEQLKQYFHLNAGDERRILIADEVAYCSDALDIIAAGSLSELFEYIICISSNPIPESRTNHLLMLPIYPLEFDEFLRATGNEWYIDLISMHYKRNSKLPDIVHQELLELHKLYLEIGGMPGSVNEYINFSSVVNVSEQHNLLWGSYHAYIQKENTETEALKMNQVLDSLAHQLMKDNKKFQYKLIRKGTTHTMYKEAIQILTGLRYIIKCNRIDKEEASPEAIRSDTANEDANTYFKLYLLDTGMLYTKIAQEYDLQKGSHLFRALLENYVAQSFQAKQYPCAFWESESTAKLDFILIKNDEIIPVELHEGNNTRSKNLSVFKQRYKYNYAIKISSKNFEFSNHIKYVPYYAAFCI